MQARVMSRASCFDIDLAMEELLLFVPALSCLCGEFVGEASSSLQRGAWVCVGLSWD